MRLTRQQLNTKLRVKPEREKPFTTTVRAFLHDNKDDLFDHVGEIKELFEGKDNVVLIGGGAAPAYWISLARKKVF